MPLGAWELRIFAEVILQCSFAQTAVALGFGHQRSAEAIAWFEARLGRKLSNRTTRVVRPTALGGGRIAGDAAAALDHLDDVYRRVDAIGAEAGGSLLMSVSRVGMESVIAPAPPTFMERRPAVAFDIRVEDGLIDLAQGRSMRVCGAET